MKRIFGLVLVAAAVAGLSPLSAFAGNGSSSDDGSASWFPAISSNMKGPYIELEGGLASVPMDRTRASGVGGFFDAALVWRPVGVDLLAGPHVGVLAGMRDSATRLDLPVGLESTLWFANVIGAGFAGDYLIPLKTVPDGDGGHFRIESLLRIHLIRTSRFSAIAPRLAISYDFSYGWGVSGGLTWQLGGVP